MATKTKVCARKTCLKAKPLAEFPHDRRQKDGYAVWCKACWKEYHDQRVKNKFKTDKAPKAPKAKAKAGKSVKATKAVKPAKEVN